MGSIETRVVANHETAEYGKFVQLTNNTEFPAVSVIRYNSPNATGVQPMTAMEVYPKYGVITYDARLGIPNSLPFGDNAALDSFGRLRTSQPYTLLDSKHVYSKNPYVYDEVIVGTGTSTLSAFDSCVDLRTNASGDYVIRQTRTRFNYQPGKSMVAFFSGLLHPEPNITKRVGLFQSLSDAPYEPSDGMFLEVTELGPAFKVVKGQGTIHSHYAPQSAWNVDRFDGTGPSGIEIDFTKAVLFVIDYQWLAVGRIRFGFEVEGILYYAHTNGHRGELTAPYMTYSNQPVRYEIRQTGTGSGLLRQICSTVISEGGQENIGREYNVDSGLITVQEGIYTPILGLKINPANINVSHIIKQVDLVNTGNKAAQFALFLNPSANASLTFTPVSTNTGMLSSGGSNGTTIIAGTSGYRIQGGFVAVGQVGQSAPVESQDVITNLARFGGGITGDSDTVILAAKGLGGTTTLYGSVNLIEKS